MNRGNYNDYNDDNGDYYRKRDRNTRDDDRYYSSNSRRDRDRRRSRSRSRDGYKDINDDDSWSSSNRDKHYDRRNRERDRDRRNYDRRDYRKHGSSNYDSDESDGGNSYSSEPNNKIIVRGLAPHITEADIQCDLIQCGLKAVSIRLIRKKRTGESRGFAFVAFQTIDEARKWLEMKQGVLILQDQFRAMIQYSFTKDTDQYDKMPTDWYCNCGVFNFKRRDNCFKCSASREESEKGGEGSDEISNILTKKIMFRNLDALTNEEKVLTALQEKIPEQVSKVSKILICRDPLTQISRGICYLNFDNLVDSMNTFQALEKLKGLQIENREVSFSYCVDSENRNIGKPTNNSRRETNNVAQHQTTNDSHQNAYAASYQYTLADVPKLAEQAASMYAQNTTERQSYVQYYTDYYTKQITQGLSTSLPAYSQYEAHSGASIAQSAIERKHKMKATEPAAPPPGTAALYPTQQVETPKGNDGKKYPTPDTSLFTYDESSGYYFDPSTNLYYDSSSQYFYNSEINQFMYWDQQKSTYILAPSTIDGNGTSATNAAASNNQQKPPPPPADEKDKKSKDQPQDKVKVAKKIVKDMEKWAKQLNQKKDYTPISVQQQARSDDSQSPPAPTFSSSSTYEAGKAADVGFTILEKKDRSSLSVLSGNSSGTQAKMVLPYHSDSDEHEDQAANSSIAAGHALSEKDYVDFDKLTCMLCKRAFPSADVLSKHLKMSNLHKENLHKYKMTQGILEIGGGSSAQNYRDRAKERRLKYGEADPVPVNRSKERFQREMEKQASIAHTYQTSAVAAAQPISEGNIGNKLLQKMGWKAGSGLGKTNQGRTEIIEAEQRVSNAGLGSKSSSYGAGPGDDYKTYIKKMMKKRYEEVE
ncbi:CLUMA_CG014238, isoform A [Clunio marinus]|uniref:CLUMA_CG014238, isoform A n=1 Tax=Clunio marinus TaxID=568069 RepID=A0A1J1ISH9_9DIPT|nr:CLUMA_CG014238, isoform A [Clunio marinus]